MTETGSAKLHSVNIGEEAKPPAAVLPYPASLFLNRSKRLLALAPGHQLEPYLRFLSVVTHAQHDIQAALPDASVPPPEQIAQAIEHGMPPISRFTLKPDDVSQTTVDHLLENLAQRQLSAEAAAAVQTWRSMTGEQRRAAMADAFSEADSQDSIAFRALVLAGLQVHFTRMAAKLDAASLKPIADGACPACGSPPVASSVVNWPGATNTRFCTCSLCATMWYVVRVKCLLCSSTESISYRLIDGYPDTIKAETCDKCHGYVKIFYQVKDPVLEALADDVASLGLDMLLTKEGWKRGGHNPFLIGY
ncbi:MAG TPA: formate dehydrogenase accessory protein FdhE [Hyphomicrobiaceae bacterium]|jgi:FdhE protein